MKGFIKMIKLTENEKNLIQLVRIADFNGTEIDFNKTWDEQKNQLEDTDEYFDIVNTKRYANLLNTSTRAIKGILGSLAKKNLVTIMKDVDGDDKPMSWVRINENQFNKIKELLSE